MDTHVHMHVDIDANDINVAYCSIIPIIVIIFFLWDSYLMGVYFLLSRGTRFVCNAISWLVG